MEQNVKFNWIQGLANHLCPTHITYIAKPSIHYQNLHLKNREFKQEMNNSIVYYS